MKTVKKAIANMKKTAATKIRNAAIWLFRDELKNIILSDGVLDYENLALFVDGRHIAEHIRDGDVAKYIEIPPDDLADAMNIDEVASHIDMDSLAHTVAYNLDTEEIASYLDTEEVASCLDIDDMQYDITRELCGVIGDLLEEKLKEATFKMSI